MVRIGKEQEKKLKAVAAAKAQYDEVIAELEAIFKYQKAQAKGPVLAAIDEALEEAVPARQVALKGMGFNDVGSLRAFRQTALTTGLSAPGSTLPEAPADGARGPHTITVGDLNTREKYFTVIDTHGTEFRFEYGTDGDRIDEFQLRFIKDSPDRDELVKAISAKYPGVEWNDWGV